MTELFGPVLARGRVRAATSDRAWVAALLEFEAALARAQAAAGVLPDREAERIAAAAADPAEFDAGELGRAGAEGAGNPAAPLARALAQRAGGARAHLGATSQDALDTAAMLIARRALDVILEDLRAAADAAAALARAHRDTVMSGRTLLQQAVPTTFGCKAAVWLSGLDAAAERLETIRDEGLAVQLGGAAGTLSGLGEAGPDVVARLAEQLGLRAPVLPWHAERSRIGDLAGALGVACGALGTVARDVTLLAQTEVGEVREGGSGGGSSAMPHKRNPVAAVATLGCARQAPGLVATLLAAMVGEHERAAGAWHAEWRPLVELLRATGGAAAWLRDCLAHLEVDAGRMRSNLDATGGLPMAERVGAALAGELGRTEAHDLVERAARSGRPFAAALRDSPEVREHLGGAELDRLLDPASYLGSAAAFTDRALRDHERR